MKKATSVFLIMCILTGLLSIISGCAGRYSFKKGANVETSFKADKKVTVGSLSETGWELTIPENTFKEDGKLKMHVLSKEESETFQSDDFTVYGSPVEFKLDDGENIRLEGPVSVTLQIPKDLLEETVAEELFVGAYYNGEWEYFMPDNVNLKKGTATVDLYHFSYFGFGKPSEESQIKTYAKSFATLQWESQNKTKRLTDSLSRQYDDLFLSMGVNSSSLRTQLTLDVISYLENEKLDTGDMSPISTLANMANAINQGKAGMDDFRNQLIEFTGKALYRTLEKDPGKFSSLANVTGGLSTAAGAISAGDTKGALQGLAAILRGSNPIVAVADTVLTAVKETMEQNIELWTQSEIEKAYQIYIGNTKDKYGYASGLEGDFDAIFTTLGGGERMMKINIIKKYCAQYGKKESDLSQEERESIVSNAMIFLKRAFDERKDSDPEIARMQQEEENFIKELKKQNLLSDSIYLKYFGINKDSSNFSIGDRLARLYTVKETVLATMDKDAAANISDEFLVKAMDQWIYWNEKGDREGYFKYMREMGYIKEPYDVDPTYAWILIEISDESNAETFAKLNEHPSYKYTNNYSRGSYSGSITFTGTDTYDEGLKGTLGLQADFSGMPQIIYPDKPVELGFSFTTTQNDVVKLFFSGNAAADFCRWDKESGKVGVLLSYFKSQDGQDSFSIDAKGSPSSYSGPLTGVLSRGSEGSFITLRTRFSMSGAQMRTHYIYQWKQIN